MTIPKKVVTVRRLVQKFSGKDKIESQIDYLLHRALAAQRGKGWEVGKGRIQSDKMGDGFTHVQCKLTFSKKKGHKTEDVIDRQWAEILRFLVDTGRSSRWQGVNWNVLQGGELVESKKPEIDNEPPKEYDYGDLIIGNAAEAFAGIYNLDDHIYRIMRVLRLAGQTNMQKREHICLYGPPGGGKTTVFKAVRDLVGPENVLCIDATATTAAGAVKIMLDRRRVIPPIVQIEEIEKRTDADLNWLLGATDDREEIQKTNFFVQDARRVQFIAMCTVNDYDEFLLRCKGALQSRFSTKIRFPHPSRETHGLILQREIKDLGNHGKMDWVEPTLKFAIDKLGITDPRQVKDICLTGQDDLLSERYQKAFMNTINPDDYPKLKEKK